MGTAMKGGKVNMSISLFPHNQEAYESLLNVPETERRAEGHRRRL